MGLQKWPGFHQVKTLMDGFQAEVALAEAMANYTWEGNSQQSSLESCAEGSDVRELGGKD